MAWLAAFGIAAVLASCEGSHLPGTGSMGNPLEGLNLSAQNGRGVSGSGGGNSSAGVVYFDDAGNQQTVPLGVQALAPDTPSICKASPWMSRPDRG